MKVGRKGVIFHPIFDTPRHQVYWQKCYRGNIPDLINAYFTAQNTSKCTYSHISYKLKSLKSVTPESRTHIYLESKASSLPLICPLSHCYTACMALVTGEFCNWFYSDSDSREQQKTLCIHHLFSVHKQPLTVCYFFGCRVDRCGIEMSSFEASGPPAPGRASWGPNELVANSPGCETVGGMSRWPAW